VLKMMLLTLSALLNTGPVKMLLKRHRYLCYAEPRIVTRVGTW